MGHVPTSNVLQQAAFALQSGDWSQAERLCDGVMEVEPRNLVALHLCGVARWQAGDLEAAHSLIQESLVLAPAQPHAWQNLARILEARGDPAGAIDAYRRALEQDDAMADAWLGLGIAQAETGLFEAAVQTLERARAISPSDVRCSFALGQAYRELERHRDAVDCYRQALQIEPRNVQLLQNLGIALKAEGRSAEALGCYEQALALDSRVPELHRNRGNALYELGRLTEALASYQRALELRPDALDVHETLNAICWQHGLHEQYLTSYEPAIQAVPQSLALRVQYAAALRQAGRCEDSEAVLRCAMDQLGSSPAAHRALGRALAGQGRLAEAIARYEEAISADPHDADCRQDLAKMLIVLERYDEALQHIERALERAPLDQALIACRGLCWRLLGDPREAVLNDYQTFVQAYPLPIPTGFADMDQFNRALNDALDTLHRTQEHPPDQTLRGGTQTYGNLFECGIREIQLLRQGIEQVLRRYITELPRDPDHPFLGRRSDTFRFTASWSSRLRQEGFHTNHTHPKGWISACYYVSLPQAVHAPGSKQGWIKFGQTNLGLAEREQVGRMIEPREGLLVLFPSYLYHGTVPFETEELRTTVAFDVVPA